MANPQNANWPSRWPMMLPLPHAIPRSKAPVPNASSVDWPQAQFAPLYLAPGSPSFQPYSYLKSNQPFSAAQPPYNHQIPPTLGLESVNLYKGGPGGDIARLPLGGIMLNNPSPRRAAYKARARLEKRVLATESAGRIYKARQRMAFNERARQVLAANAQRRKATWGWRKTALSVEASGPQGAPSLFPAPVVRMGARPTNIPIYSGIPHMGEPAPLEPIATAGLTNLYGGLALANTGDCGCGDGMMEKAKAFWGESGTNKVIVIGAAAALTKALGLW